MKIAALADIHSNFSAVKSVYKHMMAWEPDHVVVLGDIVNRGPRPSECLGFVLDKVEHQEWRLVRGNHEDYVISWANSDGWPCGFAFEVHRASYWTYQKLGCDVSALLGMPFQQSIWGPDGREVRFVHASMLGNRDGIYPETNVKDLSAKIGLNNQLEPPALLCVGHTHRPLIRRQDGVLVVNAGSAGLPFDGDRRPSYAQLTWQDGNWQAKIIRVDYDLKQAASDFHTAGYLVGAGPLAKLVLLELLEARSQLYQWASVFQARALNGEISMQESVRQHLAAQQSRANYGYSRPQNNLSETG